VKEVGLYTTARYFISYGILLFLIASPLNFHAKTLDQNNTQEVSQSYVEFKGIVIDAVTPPTHTHAHTQMDTE